MRKAFTLLELLVVVAIVALMLAIILPSLGKARDSGRQVVCLSTHRQLAISIAQYADDFDEQFPYMEMDPGRLANGGWGILTWRSILFPYMAGQPGMYDCPSELEEIYAEQDRAGQQVSIEHRLAGGIGAVNVHWSSTTIQPPFAYEGTFQELCRLADVRMPHRLILFGDGHSDLGLWGRPYKYWIWKEPDAGHNDAGFNRALQPDPGTFRHGAGANYAYADGSARHDKANDLRCDVAECWWSAEFSPHAQ